MSSCTFKAIETKEVNQRTNDIDRKERKYHKLEAYKCSICNNWHFGHKIKN